MFILSLGLMLIGLAGVILPILPGLPLAWQGLSIYAITTEFEEISLTLKRVGKAKMTLPLNNPTFPLNVAELQRLGVAYTNCGPSVPQRLLSSYRQQVQEIQAQLS